LTRLPDVEVSLGAQGSHATTLVPPADDPLGSSTLSGAYPSGGCAMVLGIGFVLAVVIIVIVIVSRRD
jgi:hypothetical protein